MGIAISLASVKARVPTTIDIISQQPLCAPSVILFFFNSFSSCLLSPPPPGFISDNSSTTGSDISFTTVLGPSHVCVDGSHRRVWLVLLRDERRETYRELYKKNYTNVNLFKVFTNIYGNNRGVFHPRVYQSMDGDVFPNLSTDAGVFSLVSEWDFRDRLL